MTKNDPPITPDVIEQFLIERHWWLGQHHTRLGYRIVRKLAKENEKLKEKLGAEGK
jgi:hypothetical protein